MDIDRALELSNDPAMNAYCEYVHSSVFTQYGAYEPGIDETYDMVAIAHAHVAVELALNGDQYESNPPEDGEE